MNSVRNCTHGSNFQHTLAAHIMHEFNQSDQVQLLYRIPRYSSKKMTNVPPPWLQLAMVAGRKVSTDTLGSQQ